MSEICRPWVRRAAALLGVVSLAIPAVHAAPGDVLGSGSPGVNDPAPARLDQGDGELSVSEQTGAFQYTHAIDVPPGRLGVQPSLALTYSSSGSRRGGIAAGWRLDLPEISRDFTDGRFTSEVWVSGLASGQRLHQHFEPAPSGFSAYRAQHDSSYTRYQKSGSQWIARTIDGGVYRFNEASQLGGATAPAHRALLTSYTDVFGNAVTYHWQQVDLGGGFHTWRPSVIRYTSNAPAGIAHHAEVEFVWSTAQRCGGTNLWTGASFDYRSGVKDVDGASRLESIVTRVRDTPSAAFRSVRTTSLRYDDSAGSCNAMHGPTRLLTEIQVSARSPSGAVTTMPPTKFEYGALWQPRTLSGTGYVLAQSPSGRSGVSHGTASTRALSLPRMPTTKSMLVDIDGDGLVDRLQIGGAKCRIQWSRNTGSGWASGGSYNLPTIPWKGALPNVLEHCTVSAQMSLVKTPGLEPPGETCQDYPTYNFYRYLDLDGDALPEIVTAIHHGYFTYDPEAPPGALAAAAPDDEGDGECENEWVPHRDTATGKFVWKVYKNLGGGQFDTTGVKVLAPVPLDVAGGDAFATRDRSIYAVNTDGAGFYDLDGDGKLDVVQAGTPNWALHRGNGTGGFAPPIAWPAPAGMAVSKTEGFPAGGLYRYVNTTQAVMDINGDGLPDLVTSNSTGIDVYLNHGAGFETTARRLTWLSPLINRTVIRALQGTALAMTEAERYQATRLVDVDGDGFLDLAVRPPTSPGVAKVYSGAGLGWWGAGESVISTFDQDAIFSYAHDNGAWTIQGELIDLDGDGVDEFTAQNAVKTRNGADPPGLLRRVDNGLGGVATIEYANLHDADVVERGGGRAPRPGVVVRSLRREGTVAAPAGTTTYAYAEPVYNQDVNGRWGFRGFTQTTETDPRGARVETYFDYGVRWDGMPVATETYTSDGALHERTWTEYGAYASGAIQTLHVTEKRSQRIFPGTGPGRGDESPIVVRESTYEQRMGGWGIWVLDQVDERIDAPSALVPQPADRQTRFDHAIDFGPATYHVKPTTTMEYEWREGAWALAGSTVEQWSGHRNTATIEQLDEAGTVARHERTYLATGQVETLTRPNQIVLRDAGESFATIRFEYDAHQITPVRVTDERGGLVSTTVDPGTGAVLVQTAPYRPEDASKQRYTRTVIDGFARPLEVYARIEGGSAGLVETLVGRFVYTDGINPTVRQEVRRDYNGSLWIARETQHDGFGRLWKETQYGDTQPAVTTYTYDRGGGVVSKSVPDPRQDNSLPVTYNVQRDSLGRVTSVHAWGLATLHVVYDGTFVRRYQETTDGSVGIDKTLYHDADGQLVRVDEVTDDGVATTRYEYDANGNLSHLVDADGVEASFAHDLAGRRTRIQRGARVWTYDYDLHGNLLAEVTPAPPGALASDYINTFTYDVLDRQTSIRAGRGALEGAPAAAELNHGITYLDYDSGCDGQPWAAFGQLCRVRLPYGSIQYAYDATGAQTAEVRSFTVAIDGGTPVEVAERLEATHNAIGAPLDVRHVRGGVTSLIRHGYDGVGLPETVAFATGSGTTLPVPTTLATLDRSYSGYVRARSAAWGAGQSWTYDKLGRVETTSAIPACVQGVCTSPQAAGESLMYLDSGNLDTQLDHASGLTFSYEYDRQHQLLGVSTSDPAAYAAVFTYSPNGRLRTAYVGSSNATSDVFPRDVSYAYVDDDLGEPIEALYDVASGAPVGQFTYDASGNLLRRTADGRTLRFWYDAVDQVRAVQQEGTSVQEAYLYDHTGNRILAYSTARGNEPARLRHWFGGAETAYTTTSAVEKAEIFVGLDGAPVARIQNGDVANAAMLISSTLGHLLAAVAPDGTALARFTYGPFGEIVRAEGAAADQFRRRFNGKELDDFTDLAYYGFRYYDRLTMTWTQPDPLFRVAPDVALESPRDAALYAFSLNNPVRFVDPDGLQSEPRPPEDPSQNGDRNDPHVQRQTQECSIDQGGCECHISCKKPEAGESEDGFAGRKPAPKADGGGVFDDLADAVTTTAAIAVDWLVPQSPEEFAASVVCGTAKKACAAVAGKLSKTASKLFGRRAARGTAKAAKRGRGGGKMSTRGAGDGPHGGGGPASRSKVDDLVADSRPLPETKGRTRQFARSGGQEAANADFDALNPSDVKDYGDGKRVGKLADGRTVVVRPSSSSGAPTLEIQDGKKYTKFRYDD